MKNLLIETWAAASGIFASVIDLFVTLFAWLFSVLLIIHNDMPRLEGLLVGILLAWFFVHREKNPILRALAAPLKIVLDILDIIWDETIEAGMDLLHSAKERVMSAVGWIRGIGEKSLRKLTGWLIGLKDKIIKKKTEEQPSE